jgi:basic amino acid/polyamine antiporter, APA family
VLGVGFGLAVIIGNTIGAGIFRAPGTIADQLPNPWLFLGVWVVGGIYALLGAIAIAELGTMIPRSGGQYVYSRYALGEYAGFIVGWSDWISSCGSTATVSLLIGQFSGALVPAFAGRGPIVAAAVAILFAVLQWRGIVWGSNIQNVTSLLKALAFLALIVAAFILGNGAGYDRSQIYNPPGDLILIIVPIIISLREVIYTYDGWSGVIYFSEEVINPARDIPRSLFGGVLMIAAIYLLVNVALLYVLPIKGVAGQEFAAGAAANVIFGSQGDTIFRVLTIVSMLSGINALHLMATRVIFGMSRDGLFTRKAAVVNDGGTPSVALWLSAFVAILFIIFARTAGQAITIVSFFFVANYTLSFISLFVLRRREPKKARPYRAWGHPWTTGLALIGSVLFLVGAVAGDTRNSLYALLLLAASYPVFLLIKWLR